MCHDDRVWPGFSPGFQISGLERAWGLMSAKKSRGPEPIPIHVSERQQAILQEIVQCRHSPQYEALRAGIVLEANRGERNERIAAKFGITRQTVALWRMRWANAAQRLKQCESQRDHEDLGNLIRTVLNDAPRPGCPPTFTPEQICHIVAVACESPADSGRPVSRWTPRELADEVVHRGIVSNISARSVGRFLKSGGSQASHVPILAKQRKRQRSADI
jgi:putative transposase